MILHLKNLLLGLFFTLAVSYCAAQPGGGGGLTIEALYNAKGLPLDLRNEKALRIRTFLTKNGLISHETFVFYDIRKGSDEDGFARSFTLPPGEMSYAEKSLEQRMYIFYGRTIMVIDFKGIIGENGGGHVDHIDSLVIRPGYFTSDRSDWNTKRYNTIIPSKDVKKGKKKAVDTSELLESNLNADYFFHRAQWHLNNNAPLWAIKDIETGILKNGNTKDCQAKMLLCNAYRQTLQYEKAIAELTSGMKCPASAWSSYTEEENYSLRAYLYTINRQYDKALKDHDTLVDISEFPEGAIIDRANFKIDLMGDYQGAINDMTQLIEKSTRDEEAPSASWYTLAKAEYSIGRKEIAFHHWYMAVEHKYSYYANNIGVIYFDSIFTKHAFAPELYMARALTYYHRAPGLGWGDSTKACLKKALANIDRAESLGLTDYKVYLYRAKVLTLLKEYEKAMQEITKAILKNDLDPFCYLQKYDIRRELGQTTWGDQNDPDFMAYKERLKKWYPPKF